MKQTITALCALFIFPLHAFTQDASSSRTSFDGFSIELPKGWHKSPDTVTHAMTPGSTNLLKIVPSAAAEPSPAETAMFSIESRLVDQGFSNAAFVRELIGRFKQAGGQGSVLEPKTIAGAELQNARMIAPTPKGPLMYDLYTMTVPSDGEHILYSFYAVCAIKRDGSVVANPDHVVAMLTAIRRIQVNE